MATTQGKHIVSTKVQHNYLVGTGLDKTLSQLAGQDFAKLLATQAEMPLSKPSPEHLSNSNYWR